MAGIRRAIRERVKRVSSRAQRVFVAAAVLGDGFGPEMVGALADLSPGVALEAIEDLAARGLIAEEGSRKSGFRFQVRRVYPAPASGLPCYCATRSTALPA